MPTVNLHRLEGRLFIEDARLCMVINVDTEAGMAQVSSRTEAGERLLADMPLTEISNRLSSTAKLDNVRGPVAMHRIFCDEPDDQSAQVSDDELQWFFNAREGRKGPFATEADAKAGLTQYILTTQDSKAKSAVRS